MFSQISRSITALALVASLFSGTIVAAAPRAQDTQQQGQTAQTTTDKKSDDKKSDDKKSQSNKGLNEAQKDGTTTASSGKPLSTNEDPRLIGKRKLNSGLIAKMSRSVESEVNLGRQLAAEFDRQAKFIDDPIITEYVNRVGQNVVLHSDAKVPFTIKVVDSDEVNAFALPGGFFYVNKGLILAADNEAELAGVMAHEIAHVAARHAVENEAKGTLTDVGLIAGSIFLGGLPGALILNGAQFGALLGFMKFSRSAEAEADRLGVQYMWAAGYDPNAMATMFEKLASKDKNKPGFISKAFATHPQSIDRLEASKALVARFPARDEYVLSTSEFQRVKARLLRMSNAKVSTTGNIAGDSSEPRRPTLKRRPASSDTTTGTDDQRQPDSKPAPPTLKRNTGDAPPQKQDDNNN